MTRHSRKYQSGDETHINYLYRLITGNIRSGREYAWEWIKTWDGPGSVWLVFDDSREPDDQLIGQYSLIPTPLSVWGKPILAGKTENCMSHPDHRGKGMYYYHEEEYFKEAKKRFQIFFTTTGDVARGAPGKVRMKLGYRAFDYWVTYSYWLDSGELFDEIYSKIPRLLKKVGLLGRGLATMVIRTILAFASSRSQEGNESFKNFSEKDAPLDEIENLWKNNAYDYGISVDRTADYLNWRINENPYVTHKYLCYFKGDQLIGYLIYTVQGKIVHIVDILAAKKEKQIFTELFEHLKRISRDAGLSQLKCYTASKNQILIDMLQAGKFFNYTELFSIKKFKRNKRATQLFVYISEDVKTDQDPWDNRSWYITDLVKEGRPYAARLVE